ncbi:HAD family hydrolase, partial [Candidatus Magnetomorum sp. HK-1]
MKKWDAVFFDFDGVILDSTNIKTKAFAQMFRQYGSEIEQKVVDYHLLNGGVSRIKKFEYFYKVLLSKQLNQQELDKLSEQFSNIVFNEILSCPTICGAMETLIFLKQNNILSFVLSGTPQNELIKIIELRKLKDFFLEIFGSPMKKEEMLENLLRRYELFSDKCLFIGDSATDFKAAKTF